MADFRLQQTGEVIQDRLNQIPLNTEGIQTLDNDKVDKVPGKGLSENDFTNDEKGKLDNLPNSETLNEQLASKAPQETTYSKTEVDELIANFITRSVNDLINYYLKSDTYTKAEVQQLIDAVKQFTYVSVAELPTASADTMNKIYLVPSTNPETKNVKDEYITISVTDQGTTTYSWEQIGSTTVDLSGYYTSAQTDTAITNALNAALASYSTTSQMNTAITTALASYYTKSEIDTLIQDFITKTVNDLTNYYLKSETFTKAEVNQLIAAVKQFTYVSVSELPTASADTMNKIYLVPSTNPGTQNVKDEYITISVTDQGTTTYSWECIGSTQIDLTNYYTKSQTDGAITYALNQALANYTTTANLNTLLAGKVDVVSGATEDNLAAFDGSGGVKDSGKKISDLQPKIMDGAAIGMGLGICDTVATTPAKVATLANFLMLKNVPVSIRFTKSINVDNATLNINSQGAKPIFIQGAALQPGVVKTEDVVTLIYDGTNWNIVEILSVSVSQSDLYVDMGLPSGRLWAIANLDATTQSGFAEVDGKPSPFKYECTFFSWGNNVGNNPISDSAFDYNWGSANDGPYAQTPGAALTANAGLSFDAARAILGAPWRDPSTEDFAELFDNVDYVDANGYVISGTNKLTTINSIIGIRLKSKNNGNVIFFPCSGYGNGQSWYNRGSLGYYWSRSLSSQTYGRSLSFDSGGVSPQDYSRRFFGCARRAVQ